MHGTKLKIAIDDCFNDPILLTFLVVLPPQNVHQSRRSDSGTAPEQIRTFCMQTRSYPRAKPEKFNGRLDWLRSP